jgi:hypothetical protein
MLRLKEKRERKGRKKAERSRRKTLTALNQSKKEDFRVIYKIDNLRFLDLSRIRELKWMPLLFRGGNLSAKKTFIKEDIEKREKVVKEI